MVTSIRLNDFSTTPLYNIKAVVQATNISPSTLRAWERRYNMCQPQRSDSGYRLYSDRDIAVIRWLKAQVDAGMSISQAVAWYQTIVEEMPDGDTVNLPDPTGRALDAMTAPTVRVGVQDYANLQLHLLEALLNYDEPAAEQVLSSAFALYAVEQVGEHVIMPVLIEVGERWHRGELSITCEHYATSYLHQRLAALLRTAPGPAGGPVIWVGCAPGEQHEIGAMLLAVFLRRAGYPVRYLGHDLPETDLVHEVMVQAPAMVLLSATTVEAAQRLYSVCEALVRLEPPRPIVGYGGRAFNQHPDLRDTLPGIFLGATAGEAVDSIGELLTDRFKSRPYNAQSA